MNMHKQQDLIQKVIHSIKKYTVLQQSNHSLDSTANIILLEKYSSQRFTYHTDYIKYRFKIDYETVQRKILSNPGHGLQAVVS